MSHPSPLPNLIQIPFELPGKIYRSPMPFGAFDQGNTTLAEYRQEGVNTVVILTEPWEDQRYANRDLARVYAESGMEVVRFPIDDFNTPQNIDDFKKLLDEIINRASRGENLAIHCYAGRGRTGTVIALLARKIRNTDGVSALNWVRQYFPAAETASQENLIRNLTFDE